MILFYSADRKPGHFIAVSREGKMIQGFGGIEKYY